MIISSGVSLEIAGENALIIYFSNSLSDASASDNTLGDVLTNTDNMNIVLNQKVQQFSQLVSKYLPEFIFDIVPSYASILIVFDLSKIDHFLLGKKLQQLFDKSDATLAHQGNVVELPVYYSLESGQDLARIAKHSGLSVQEVIDLHQKIEYSVFAIGFAPGFAYLGDVDERIAMPRLETPRLAVPKGAVAIADNQTAVYPAKSPGGWNIIGLCPVDMFEVNNTPHMPVKVGDKVKFKAIDKDTFIEMSGVL